MQYGRKGDFMTGKKHRIKNLILKFYLLLVICPLIITSFSVKVSASENQKVRVGYYERKGFQEGMSDSTRKSGYAYEYLQRLSDYTGWKYEYVYGDLPELKEKFQNNEIDIIAGFSKDDDIPSNMEFAENPFGTENCNIYKKADNSSIKSGYIASLIQKNIGVVKDSKEEKYLKAYQEENGISFLIIEYDDMKTMIQALNDGDLDCITAEDMDTEEDEDLATCVSIEQDDFYLGISSSKRTLLREANNAASLLREEDPYFLQKLYAEYYQNTLSNILPSEIESSWLLTHDTLKIGYLDGYLPFCESDKNNKVNGILYDVVEAMKKEPELKKMNIETVLYPSVEELYEALNNKEIQAVFPSFDDEWYAGQLDTRVSTQVISTTMNVIFEGEYTSEIYNKIAVAEHSLFQLGYVQKYYPDSQLVYVDSLEECVKAVKEGRASATILSSYRMKEYLSRKSNSRINFLGLQQACPLGFSVRSEDIGLLSLLNRSIRIIGADTLDSYVNKYSLYEKAYSLSDFITDHLFESAVLVFLFVGGILTAFILYVQKSIKTRKQMEIATQEIHDAKDRMEDALQKAENANEAKSRFLFNMSHDIRTPMNAIMGYAELLNQDSEMSERAKRYIGNIRKSGDYLLELINEVLEMARIESETVELNEETGNLTDMYDTLQVMFAEECHRCKQTLNFDIHLSHPWVRFDQRKVKAIFLNIVSNAVKYTKEEGTILVQVNECESKDEGLVTVKSVIKDNGIGMTKEFLPKIFDSFSREKTVTENKIVGSGLGMGIVKKYLDMMNGKIHIESNPGQGTEVTVILTFQKEKELKSEKDINGELPVEMRNMRILLAEDNELNREIATEILKDAGFEVEFAEDGIACVNAIRNTEPGFYDLVLMDMQMPNMDGLQATREIRHLQDQKRASVKIIAVTANVFESDRKQAIEAGMDGFTGKPIEISKLLAEINRVMKER